MTVTCVCVVCAGYGDLDLTDRPGERQRIVAALLTGHCRDPLVLHHIHTGGRVCHTGVGGEVRPPPDSCLVAGAVTCSALINVAAV